MSHLGDLILYKLYKLYKINKHPNINNILEVKIEIVYRKTILKTPQNIKTIFKIRILNRKWKPFSDDTVLDSKIPSKCHLGWNHEMDSKYYRYYIG